MKIVEKLNKKHCNLGEEKPITVAFLGDSVTQGCFEIYLTSETSIETEFDYKSAYSTRFREILNIFYPNVQINVINSGISGDSASGGLARLDRDVLSYHPDLVVVSYGLNDSCRGRDGLAEYLNDLDQIFKKINVAGAEAIFLTQNVMCTHNSNRVHNKLLESLADNFSKIQNEGVLDEYFDKAKEVCGKNGIVVCDVHEKWNQLLHAGVDTTELLANKLNHPIREIHYYMAIKLIETIFEK